MEILGSKGAVRGLIGNTAIHLRKDAADEKAPKVHELYVDIGASSEEEVREAGIRVGHPAVYVDQAELLGKAGSLREPSTTGLGASSLRRCWPACGVGRVLWGARCMR